MNVNRNAALQRKGLQIAMFLLITPGQFCLLSYWQKAGIWALLSGFLTPELPRGFPVAFGHFPAAFLYLFSSDQQLTNSL
jgi:hypothetical protein